MHRNFSLLHFPDQGVVKRADVALVVVDSGTTWILKVAYHARIIRPLCWSRRAGWLRIIRAASWWCKDPRLRPTTWRWKDESWESRRYRALLWPSHRRWSEDRCRWWRFGWNVIGIWVVKQYFNSKVKLCAMPQATFEGCCKIGQTFTSSSGKKSFTSRCCSLCPYSRLRWGARDLNVRDMTRIWVRTFCSNLCQHWWT